MLGQAPFTTMPLFTRSIFFVLYKGATRRWRVADQAVAFLVSLRPQKLITATRGLRYELREVSAAVLGDRRPVLARRISMTACSSATVRTPPVTWFLNACIQR